MRVVIQRVKRASVSITPETKEDHQEEGEEEGEQSAAVVVSNIEKGLVCLVGVHEGDEREDAEWLCKRIVSAKLFEGMSEANKDKRWRSSVKQNAYEILVVSQARIDNSIFLGSPQCRSRFALCSEAVLVNCLSSHSRVLPRFFLRHPLRLSSLPPKLMYK